MSIQALNWAREQRVGKASAKQVLCYLADRASNSTNSCHPSSELICEETELKARTVTDALKLLRSLGLITTKPRYGKFGERLKGDVQTLHLDAIADVTRAPMQKRGKVRAAELQELEATRLTSTSGAETETTREPVENQGQAQNLRAPSDANFAEDSAKFAPNYKEPTGTRSDDDYKSSATSSNRPAAKAGAPEAPPGHQDAPADELPSREDRVLRSIDERLSVVGLTRELQRLEIDPRRISLLVAASDVMDRARKAGTRVSNPVVYVAAAISRAPDDPAWAITPSEDLHPCPDGEHVWTGPYRDHCQKCDQERPGWREERDHPLECPDGCSWSASEDPNEQPRCTVCDTPKPLQLVDEGAHR